MIYNSKILRAQILGGVISPTELSQLTDCAKSLGNKELLMGRRQDFLFSNETGNNPNFPVDTHSVYYSENANVQKHPNVMSSYVSLELSRTRTKWLKEGVYLNILSNFRFKPTFKINIVDPKQGLIPIYSGNVNFIASEIQDYWYVYLRKSIFKEEGWFPVLIHTFDLHKFAEVFEEVFEPSATIDQMFDNIFAVRQFNTRVLDHDPSFPTVTIPYYEGLTKMSDGKYWLGIYYRKNNFQLDFLSSLAELCSNLDIGTICLTPWSSIVVKGIEEEDIIYWTKLLGLYGINVRHSASELNWYLKELDRESYKLKQYLVRELDKIDVRTKDLSFTIKTSDMTVFSSVLIQETPSKFSLKRTKYDVYHTQNFEQNSTDFILFKNNVSKEELPRTILALSKRYYELLEVDKKVKVEETKEAFELHPVHQCPNCMTIYDDEIGDDMQEIAPNTSFADLPKDYSCWMCETSIAEFELVEIKREIVEE